MSEKPGASPAKVLEVMRLALIEHMDSEQYEAARKARDGNRKRRLHHPVNNHSLRGGSSPVHKPEP